MIFLVFEILAFVIAAAVVGYFAGWLIRGGAVKRLRRSEAELRKKLEKAESDLAEAKAEGAPAEQRAEQADQKAEQAEQRDEEAEKDSKADAQPCQPKVDKAVATPAPAPTPAGNGVSRPLRRRRLTSASPALRQSVLPRYNRPRRVARIKPS